jgi:hypothetical protein
VSVFQHHLENAVSYPPPPGQWPPHGYASTPPPYYAVVPVWKPEADPLPPNNLSVIALLAIGLPLLLLSACGALFLVLTPDRGHAEVRDTISTGTAEQDPPDIRLDLSPLPGS